MYITDFKARHVSARFGMRRENGYGHRQRGWPKLEAVVHTHSHLIIGAVPGVGPSQDSSYVSPAMRQTLDFLEVDPALADPGYDAEHNHRLDRAELGVRRTMIRPDRRNTGSRWPRTPYRRAMRRRFERELYDQRWQTERGFSQHKRHLGLARTARRDDAQGGGLVLCVIAHSLVLPSEAA